jgi:hypothetical protein
MAKFDGSDDKMKLQSKLQSSTDANDDACTSILDFKMPPRTTPLRMSTSSGGFPFTHENRNRLNSQLSADADADADATTMSSAGASSSSSVLPPQWWSSRMSLSSRSLIEESVENDLHTPTKRKASQTLLDDDDENDSDDCIARHMRMALPSSIRSSKMPRRCHSMFSSFPDRYNNSSSMNMQTTTRTLQGVNVDDEDDEDDISPPPPFLLLSSDGSLSTSTSRTLTDNLSSGGLEEDDDDDDEDVAIQASLMGRPVLQRSSTIKDQFDLATSIEVFRSSLLDQQQQQQQQQQPSPKGSREEDVYGGGELGYYG